MRFSFHIATAFLLVSCHTPCLAQTGTVTAQFTLAPHSSSPAARHASLRDVVLWLTPFDSQLPPPAPRNNLRLVQKNKEFSPHLLVIPTGSSVDFPNLDPFFHNVFSLFNGKRFDLGLYESGTHRAVRFDREGVSYIFCNIHPEMGAVVVALDSPYYAISAANGSVTISGVPAGRYHVHVWAEQLQTADAANVPRILQVGTAPASLGHIALTPSADPLSHHKNKFGSDYPETPLTKY